MSTVEFERSILKETKFWSSLTKTNKQKMNNWTIKKEEGVKIVSLILVPETP